MQQYQVIMISGWHLKKCYISQIPPLPPKPVTTVSAAEAKSKKQLGQLSNYLSSMLKMKYLTWHEHGTKKNLSPWQESNPWPPEHQAGALSTELRELMESKVIFTEFMWQVSCILQGSALPNSSQVVISEWRWRILSLVIKFIEISLNTCITNPLHYDL